MINSHPSHCLNMSPILRSHHPPKPTVFLSNKEPPLQGIKMSVLPYWRGNSWSDSNETIRSSDEEMNQNFTGIFPPPLAKSRAKRGLIILVDIEVIEDSREFWQNCLIGMIMDFRRFSVRSVQRIINNAWRLRDRVTVVGRSNHNYVIHFNDSKDQVFIWQHRPWSIDWALMVMDVWRPNTVLGEVNLPLILIWVQIWGLPLEYQIPNIARKLAQTIGTVV